MNRAPGTLRIIAGALKGRRLAVPPGDAVRPTSDRLRETLFNVLGPTLDDVRVLDVFAGTGALGLEAISRGAAHATFVERDANVARLLESNIAQCRVADRCAVLRRDFLTMEQSVGSGVAQPFDVALLDPPYAIEDLGAVLTRVSALMAPAGRVVLEHARKREAPEHAGTLVRTRVLLSGDSALSFFTVNATGADVLP